MHPSKTSVFGLPAQGITIHEARSGSNLCTSLSESSCLMLSREPMWMIVKDVSNKFTCTGISRKALPNVSPNKIAYAKNVVFNIFFPSVGVISRCFTAQPL